MDLKQFAFRATKFFKAFSPRYLTYLGGLIVFVLILMAQLSFHKVRGEEIKIKEPEQKEQQDSQQEEVSELLELKKICVEVSGAVMVPGVYCMDEGSLVINAVEKAGGINTSAYAGNYVGRTINLARTLVDHEKVYIPFATEMICEAKDFNYVDEEIEEVETDYKSEILGKDDDQNDSVMPSEEPQDIAEPDGQVPPVQDEEPTPTPDPSPSEECINLNAASLEELTSIKGIGESTAQKIIDARPFTDIEELLDVNGIGESKYNLMKDLVCI
ncbi:helix-hairpin-helix domain-containing protein [Candidatus Dojkabacteria bacterium]|uniref:Helix-hairpin-helix domain-containing protein n=1 Tax=Candidatus Dojkabacteria bacterium TaxID=2099670 RepID=A0A955HXI9_9BACT|nr:helix-hairpin-helix domain-containing protein [Candidatus Dojkabacteria bacterium]